MRGVNRTNDLLADDYSRQPAMRCVPGGPGCTVTAVWPWSISRALASVTLAFLVPGFAPPAHAMTNVFFNPSQPVNLVASNINAWTITSSGYLIIHSVDGYWSSYPGGPPTGRFFSVVWPNGVQAQAITAGPLIGRGANITIQRVDGQPFELRSFTAKLLANTAATGAAFEIMPLLDGEDALDDPLMFNASGYGGQSFSHTPALTGYDAYKIHLFVDYALAALTLVDASPLVPASLRLSVASSNVLLLSWPAAAVGYSLQQTVGLNPPNWSAVTNTAQLAGPEIQVTVPLTSGERFFRLKHP
jgi:hypothetical protein